MAGHRPTATPDRGPWKRELGYDTFEAAIWAEAHFIGEQLAKIVNRLEVQNEILSHLAPSGVI